MFSHCRSKLLDLLERPGDRLDVRAYLIVEPTIIHLDVPVFAKVQLLTTFQIRHGGMIAYHEHRKVFVSVSCFF